MTPKIGTRKVMICKATKLPVIMEYDGFDSSEGANGHKNWLCLHNETPEEDAQEVKDFPIKHGNKI